MSTQNPDLETTPGSPTDLPSTEEVHAALLTMKNGAAVWGSDGELGPMLAIVIDPATKTATEIAVRNAEVVNSGRLIPVRAVISATPDRIHVQLSRSEFFQLDRFMVPYRSAPVRAGDPVLDAPDLWLIRPASFLLAVHENVPNGDIAIHQGLAVFNAAGHRAGSVEGWNFHPDTGQLASLAFSAEAFLQRHTILIEASSVESIDDHGVRLTLSAAELDKLKPTTK